MSEIVPEADELGVLLAQLAPLQRREDELKKRLRAYGRRVLDGALFRATVAETIGERLDAKAVREEMGEAWCAARSKIVISQAVRVTARS